MAGLRFFVTKQDSFSKARCGVLETAHSSIDTPVFMPVGTRGAVKTLTNQHLRELDARIILANTYHLMLRPGKEILEKVGGLHRMMQWDRSLLTDSGGFQVFSLAPLNAVTEEGVDFRSHIDGRRYFLGPTESMEIQKAIGSDIVMAFDQCVPFPCTREEAEAALRRTLRWAEQCQRCSLSSHQSLFGIVQGSTFPDLRVRAAEAMRAMDFAGYALGGLSVGEPAEVMNAMVEQTAALLPPDKPRYLMGVGTPRNIVESVMRGVDMFDCVMPTRNARNGTAFTWQGKVNIKAGRYAEDLTPLDPELDHYASGYSKAYIRHLLNVDEITGLTLVTLQNLAFYLDFMKRLRQAIQNDELMGFYRRICEIYP